MISKIALIYLLMANLLGFAIFGIDKYKARKGKWRVPEKILLWIAFLGGSLGTFLGMLVFRHKTKHQKFMFLLPLFLFLHFALAYYVLVVAPGFPVQ